MGTKQRTQVEMTSAEIESFLSAHRTANLVTLGPSGDPHAAAMWFALIEDPLPLGGSTAPALDNPKEGN